MKHPKRRKPLLSEATEESKTGAEDAPEIRESDLQGLKFFSKIDSLLELRHDVGTRRDTAHRPELRIRLAVHAG